MKYKQGENPHPVSKIPMDKYDAILGAISQLWMCSYQTMSCFKFSCIQQEQSKRGSLALYVCFPLTLFPDISLFLFFDLDVICVISPLDLPSYPDTLRLERAMLI